MNKWKKILLLFAGLVLVTAACFLSWSYGFRQGMHAGGFTSSMAELMLLNNHIEEQMANANCEGVKQAINDYLKVIEKYKDVKDSFISGTTYYADEMLGHVRLARIEKHVGNLAYVQKHMEKAKEACVQLKRQDCSEEKIIWFAKRLEERHPIACLANEK